MNQSINITFIQNYIQTNHLSVEDYCKQCHLSIVTWKNIIKKETCPILTLFHMARGMNVGIKDLVL